MSWDAIGAIAEMLAAIGVIISLVFVGIQVRKSNAEARSATMQATTDTEVMMVSTLARYADIWDKVNRGQALDGATEARRGIMMFNLVMIDAENRFHQLQAGNLDQRSWSTRLKLFDHLVQLPIYEPWRQSPGGLSRGADFLDLLDGIVANLNKRQAEVDDVAATEEQRET